MEYESSRAFGKIFARVTIDMLSRRTAVIFTDGSCIISEAVEGQDDEDCYVNMEVSYHDSLPERW